MYKIGAVAALCAVVLSGCKSVHSYNSRHDTTLGKKDKVQNVHRGTELPEHLRRVALLPLARGRYDHIEMGSIRDNFVQEIGKRNLFEVVAIEPERMEEMFGSEEFASVELLPTTLLSKLHTVYAIDGVMLIDISYYNPYQPVGIGVRAKLLDGHTGEIVWAADEVFDAANPAVSNAARKYFQTQSVNQYPLHHTQSVLHSPTRFSKYVADAIFSTIQPPR
ncbi:hypothetical protein [Pelagicoccus sp. SDUM812003]|uniref:hypothetical protein n=1 Tax=Pelagicoccus sp. SDUM812003 TaxID=3041267 RepID=UPI002811401B|nr:hypothetical protein [Pelagicoccus sp. SDUM812003]